MKYRIDDSVFIKIVNNSISIRQVLLKIGHAPKGGNYETVKKRIKKLNISTAHFLGKASNRGQYFGPKRLLSEYLVNDGAYRISSTALKKRLIKENLIKPICSSCTIPTWLNNPMPLELDHIDGNKKNNSLINLRLLCPNCHWFTPTYRGRK